MESKNKPVLTARHPNLVDLVKHERQVRFLMLEEGKLKARSQIQEGESVLIPPPLENLPHAETMSEGSAVISAYEDLNRDPSAFINKLYEDTYLYLTELSQMPDEAYYALLTIWVLLSYIHDRFAYSPIIALFAVVERGKSRTGKGLTFVAYRGLTINSLRESFIFRMAESLGTTMFFDISQFRKVMERANCEDMLLARFEQNATVPRVNHPEWGAFKDTTFYRVYGPTIIGTNQALTHALSSRSITIVMPQSERVFADNVTPEKVTDLRARLTAFRAYAMRFPLPPASKPAKGRLGDIAKPLVQVALMVSQDCADTVLSLIKQIEEDRMEDKSQTNEAEALSALLKCRSNVLNGKVALDSVREVFNGSRSAEGQYSAPSFGRLLKSLGLNTGGRHCRTSDGRSALPWDESKIEQVCRAYGIDPDPEKTPEHPVQPDSHSKTGEKQGGLDLEDQEDLEDKRGIMKPNYGD